MQATMDDNRIKKLALALSYIGLLSVCIYKQESANHEITIDDYKDAAILLAKAGKIISNNDKIVDMKFYNFPDVIIPKKWNNKAHENYFDRGSYFLFKRNADKTYTGIQIYKLSDNKIEVLAIQNMTHKLSEMCQNLYAKYGYFLAAQDDFDLPEKDKQCLNALWRDGIIDNIVGDHNIIVEIKYNPKLKKNEPIIIKNEYN